MPKVACRCGYVFDLSPIPAPNWNLVVSDRVLFKAEHGETAEKVLDIIYDESAELLQCPQCERLHVAEVGSNVFRSYCPEKPE